MNKIMLVILVFAVFIVPAAAQEVYLAPQQSNAAYSSTADVEIWVGATENEFQSGQINLTYDHNCANVTDWKRNTTNFSMGGWSHYDGRELITFLAADPLPTGKYMVGTLTVQCVKESEEGGETVLAFAEPSELFDAKGNPVAVDWRAGTFGCSGSTRQTATTQTSSGGGSRAMKTETPTASPLSTVTPGMTAAAPPASTITPTPAAATTSPVATASAFVSPAPTQTPEEKKELPGFEAVTVILGVLVVLYLKSKRGPQD